MNLPSIDFIQARMDSLRATLRTVGTESIAIKNACGRVLGQDVLSFRDSPAIDVSAMDGYALRKDDLRNGSLPIVGTATAGAAPLTCHTGTATRIFTGAAVPAGADCVVQREHCQELPDRIVVDVPSDTIHLGQNIRRRGENATRGKLVLGDGSLLDGPKQSTLVSFAERDQTIVRNKVRVSILNTGDELLDLGQPILDWQIRDSNGPFLQSMLGTLNWVDCHRAKVHDSPEAIRSELDRALQSSDAVILTGGVSMGDTDHVPKTVIDCGGEIIFHRIPIRPGKPLLGAVGPRGQLILGLPGNPVSVAVTFRRYAVPLLRHVAGFREVLDRSLKIQVQCGEQKKLDLLWFRLVSIETNGIAQVLDSKGSGDVASLGQSDGFVEVPPGTVTDGFFSYFPWSF